MPSLFTYQWPTLQCHVLTRCCEPCTHQVRFKVVAKASLDLVVGGGGAADGKAGGGSSLMSQASDEGGGGGADLPRRADLVVSEIFGDDPLAEGAHVPWLSPPRDAAARTQHVPW